MENLIITASPHIKSKDTTHTIMRDVLIALAPAAIAAVVLHGWYALVMMVVCVGTAVLSEFLFNLLAKKKQTVCDLSAAVTGLLLALNLSTKVNVWQCIVGAVFAIVIVKCAFGGIGSNFANPAITARIFMLISFTELGGGALRGGVDLVGGATPLEALKGGVDVSKLPSLLDMLLGNRGGTIGEGCIIALLIGFIYLVVRRVIKWYVPAAFVGTVFVLAFALTGFNITETLYHVFGGGLFLGAIFMATDYSTTPLRSLGKLVFAVGAGLITVLIRFFGNYPEGVSFAILLMNILSPYIDKLVTAKPFGGVKNEN